MQDFTMGESPSSHKYEYSRTGTSNYRGLLTIDKVTKYTSFVKQVSLLAKIYGPFYSWLNSKTNWLSIKNILSLS